MKLIHLNDLTFQHWQTALDTMFSPTLGEHMGVDPNIIAHRPTLEQFYANIMDAHERNAFQAWGIIHEGKLIGYTLLDKRIGEWEIATVLSDSSLWGSSLGARATLHALQWAFEDDEAEWVVAFTQGKDPTVREMLERGGFRPLANMLVMDKATWQTRWKARMTKER